jgi:hypothetical protein
VAAVNSADSIRPYLVVFALFTIGWAMRSAAGRLAPRVAVGSILFLVSRWPVLVGWAIGTVGMMALMLRGAAENGRDVSGDWLFLGGLSAFCGFGFAALAVSPLFFAVRALSPKIAFPLEDGEVVLHTRSANHFLTGEGRGGELLLTTRRLGFCPHRFNVQRDPWSVPLDRIQAMSVEGDRFLLVDTGGEAPEWVVTENPAKVASYIDALASRPEAERAATSDDARRTAGLG